MKKEFLRLFMLACVLIGSFGGLSAQPTNVNLDSLKKDHGRLMSKASSYFGTNKSEIDARIKKAERVAGQGARDTSGAKSLIKLYQSDSTYYQAVIYTGDSLLQKLREHNALAAETMQKGDAAGKFLMENDEKIDKVKMLADYAKDVAKQVDKRLKSTNKELQEMRDYAKKQAKKK